MTYNKYLFCENDNNCPKQGYQNKTILLFLTTEGSKIDE